MPVAIQYRVAREILIESVSVGSFAPGNMENGSDLTTYPHFFPRFGQVGRVLPRLLAAVVVLSIAPLPTVWAADDGGSNPGRQLAEKVYNRPVGDYASAHAEMTLVDEGHAPRIRDMYTYRVKKGHGVVWSLIRFVAPPSIDGTAVLTKDASGSESEQWVYLPALDRVRRISSSRKGGRFVGSDFYYEDLRDRPVSKDRHRVIGKETLNGVVCTELESIPVTRDSSVYSKRISWIDPKTLIPLRVDFYEGGAKPSKRLVASKVVKIQGYYTVVDSVMTDLNSGHKTRITVKTLTYKRHLPDMLFTRRALSDPEFESRYRP